MYRCANSYYSGSTALPLTARTLNGCWFLWSQAEWYRGQQNSRGQSTNTDHSELVNMVTKVQNKSLCLFIYLSDFHHLFPPFSFYKLLIYSVNICASILSVKRCHQHKKKKKTRYTLQCKPHFFIFCWGNGCNNLKCADIHVNKAYKAKIVSVQL